MTRETFKKAQDIIADIETLRGLKDSCEDGLWTFSLRSIRNEIVKDDLVKFVDDEIAKLEKELKNL